MLSQSKELTAVGVALVVSGEGLKVVEALTSEVLSNTFIKNLRFAPALFPGWFWLTFSLSLSLSLCVCVCVCMFFFFLKNVKFHASD
jgi:hypothetical protein